MERIGDYRRNCVLVAMKEVSGKSDAEIFEAVRRYGYRNNHGMWSSQYEQAMVDVGIKLGRRSMEYDMRKVCGSDPFKPITVRAILKSLQKGVWLVRTRGHIFVVRGGQLVDPNFRKASLGRRIVDVVEVLNPYVPVIKGLVTFVRAINPKRLGSASYGRYGEMVRYIGKHGPVKKEQLFRDTAYHAGDYRFDLERGNIKLV